ncbi:MAG TPA: hypothetical protein VFC19_50095 [Candidatus Limnocylindrales bacterium]|nr:hypothetical protein [Candidatus Limnocylindrales bacterium]
MAVELNEVGDVILDPAAMRALAGNDRYFLLERLRKSGPSTAAELEADIADLVRLAEVELVTGPDDSGRWTAVGRGLFLRVPDDPEDAVAARELVGLMLLDGADTPRRWVREEMHRLEALWFAAAGKLSVRVGLTPRELDEIQAAIEKLLEPYVNRRDEAVDDLRDVRILGYFLPSAG